ncbi:keratin, type I cytoskeletal 19-like isoform X2 [Spea bombifrons]|uniref:keratin, type I cytoskeletal 19-like isoform X2 n=1 Tax=Spea bombifrons TaxID=233779 RepID=UPI00234BE776|nr:keratin, type I cytoskeletal 19-like isoform X2 [Spea bombifrons]
MSPIHSGKNCGFSAKSCHLGGHPINVTRHVSSVHQGSSHNKKHGGSHYGGSHLSYHGGYHAKHHEGFHISHHKTAYPSHHGGHYSAPSVHGGSGGKGISISKHSSGHSGHSKNFGSHVGWNKGGLFGVNEKETMQALNNRLASYLEKVSSLEQENDQLERNIREWYDRNQPSALPDFSNYFRTIRELQGEISATSVENARIVLQIDNARLAADDFRSKYEMELRLTNNVETDMNGLRRLLEGLNVEICNLEGQVRNLQEELQQMRRNHEEEVNSLRAQLGQRVSVEVNAAPSVDLNRSLSEIRQQYEELMERNLREVENMFMQRSEELNREVTSGAAQLQSVQTELIDLKRDIQTLEIELQSQLSMKSALEGTLAETEATYNSQLSQLQGLINAVESQLAQIRSDLEQQNHQYRILMDQKTHLEMEIATYKRLLEGHDFHASGHSFLGGTHGFHHTSVKHSHHAKC